MRTWTIGKKLFTGGAALLACLVVSGLYSYVNNG
jgi:hypothetical protein